MYVPMPKSCSFRTSIPMRTGSLYLQAVPPQGVPLRAGKYAGPARRLRRLQDTVAHGRGLVRDAGEPCAASRADRIPHGAAGRTIERGQPFTVEDGRDAALIAARAGGLP